MISNSFALVLRQKHQCLDMYLKMLFLGILIVSVLKYKILTFNVEYVHMY